MKSISKYYAILLAFAMLSFSCESTKQENVSSLGDQSSKTETVGTTVVETNKKVEDVVITLESAPKQTIKNRAFAAPYVISVKDTDGNPIPNYALTVSYPSSRTNDDIVFSKTEVVTNDTGIASYTPDTPSFSVNSEISFYPKSIGSNPRALKKAANLVITAPYKVATNAQKKGILIAIVDYNENGQMVLQSSLSSSSNLLGELWRAGYTYSQNADFHNNVNKDNPEGIYKDAINLVGRGSMFAYVIYGKVKYVQQITQTDDGYTCTITGEISCIELSTGNIVYKTQKTVTANNASKWAILKDAQTALAKELKDSIIYSL